MKLRAYLTCFNGILQREFMRFLQQRSRFLSALVRPLLWLIVFASGFRAALGIAIIPPYETYITYQVYIVPGLIGIILLFNGMQSSLSMVYDREMGSMRVMLTSPISRPFLLFAKLVSGALVSLTQVYAFALIAMLFGFEATPLGWIALFPACLLAAIMLGAIGLVLSSLIRQLENFAGVMNFVVFPMFFLSSALYPLWKMQEANQLLYQICQLNPFTHAVEMIRFAAYGKLNMLAAGICLLTTLFLLMASVWSYDPKYGQMHRKIGN